MINYNHRNSI